METRRSFLAELLVMTAWELISRELSIKTRVEMVLQRSGVQKFIGVVGTEVSMTPPW